MYALKLPNSCLNFQETLGVVDSGDDLLVIADDTGIVEQGPQFALAILGNPLRVKLQRPFDKLPACAKRCTSSDRPARLPG